MTEKYVMVSLDDEKSQKLGEAISNPSCKKIIGLLAEKELSASEISAKSGIQLNALDYNLKKLIDSGIIEKSKHFWSVKGKKIPTYKVVNKMIVIQPKKTSNSNVYSKLKGIAPMILVLALLTAIFAISYDLIIPKEFNISVLGDQAYMNTLKITNYAGSNECSSEGNLTENQTVNNSECSFDNGTDYTFQHNVVSDNKQFLRSPVVWFAIGSLVALVIFLTWNWKRL